MKAEPGVSPHNLDAEKAVLGAAMVRPESFDKASELLEPRDFFRDAHRRIFVAMIALAERNEAIDFLTLKTRLACSGDLEACDGPAYLASLADGVPRSANIEDYAAIVHDTAQKRRLMAAASDVLSRAADADKPAAVLIDEAERLIFAVGDRGPRSGFMEPAALAQGAFTHLQDRIEGRIPAGLPTGFPDFDQMTHGLQPGALILIAARPSMGKSAFATQVAFAAAQTVRVGLFSLEMGWREVAERIIAASGGVDLHQLRSGRLRETEYGKVSHAIGRLGSSFLHVDDSGHLTALEVRGKARRLKASHGLGLVVIDYLQLMQVARAENRNLAIADISRSLKLLARELEVPVIALSQLSRETERRGDKRPMLSDLRDSGALEQDADLVAFLHRPEVYDASPDKAGKAELIIAKQRNGPVGQIDLLWDAPNTRFLNMGV